MRYTCEKKHRLKIMAYHIQIALQMNPGDRNTMCFWANRKPNPCQYPPIQNSIMAIIEKTQNSLYYLNNKAQGNESGIIEGIVDLYAPGI